MSRPTYEEHWALEQILLQILKNQEKIMLGLYNLCPTSHDREVADNLRQEMDKSNREMLIKINRGL